MDYSANVKQILLNCIDNLGQQPEKYAVDPEKDFSRCRKLPFKTMAHMMLTMEASSIDGELDTYFGLLPGRATVSAFLQQKDKLRPDAFSHLLYDFNSKLMVTPFMEKFQLLACDGSGFYIYRNSTDEASFFPPSGTAKLGYNEIHAVALYDIMSARYEDLIVQPSRQKNEFAALCNFADRYHAPGNLDALFLADRGFASYNVYAHMIENNQYFLIRVKDINASRLLFGENKDLGGEFEEEVSRILTRTQSAKKRLQPSRSTDYRFICANVPLDYITDSNPEYELRLRALRFKITDDTYENVITNLPADTFTASILKDIYNMRWGIELSFRDLKHTIGASAFHSKKRSCVENELWIRMVLFNFCSAIATHVHHKGKRKKHACQLNFAAAARKCRIFLRSLSDFSFSVEDILAKLLLPIRLNRQFSRRLRLQPPLMFCYRV